MSESAVKSLKKLGKSEKTYVLSWIEQNLINVNNAEEQLHRLVPLRKDLKGSYKIRVGGYRLICNLKNDKLIIVIVKMGARKNVYRINEPHSEY